MGITSILTQHSKLLPFIIERLHFFCSVLTQAGQQQVLCNVSHTRYIAGNILLEIAEE